jgi:hypothetical protein
MGRCFVLWISWNANQPLFISDFLLKGAIIQGHTAPVYSLTHVQTFPPHFSEYYCPFMDSYIWNAFCISYHLTSLLFYSIAPGPKEADHESLPNFMWDWVDNLLMLYDDGIIIQTRKFPEGLSMLISSNGKLKIYNGPYHIRLTSLCYITGGLLWPSSTL